MTVKKTQQTLSTTLENTQQALDGLENGLDAGRQTKDAVGTETSNPVGAHPVRDLGEGNAGLPEGWVGVDLLTVCDVKTGKVDANHATPNGEYTFFTCALEPLKADTFSFEGELILLPGNGANVGHVGFYSGKVEAYQRTYVLHNHRINPKYVYLHLKSFWRKVNEEKQFGSATNYIKMGNFESYAIPLPPLAEQTVIAQTLDTLLAQVDNIKTRLDAIPNILKTFRQSVLAAAVSGKLTEAWRGENECGADSFPISWEKKGFSEFGVLSRGKSKHRPRNDARLFGDEYPFIQTGEVANAPMGIIRNAKKYYSKFGLQQSRLFPAGTLCITIAANIADTAILGLDACFPDSVVGFTPNDGACDTLFVKYLIDVNKANLEAFAPATAQKNINLKILNEMKFPFPSVEEQTEIVRRVEELFAFADQIEQQVKNAQGRVNNLTQSILAKAFRGELTAQWRAEHPDLITGDNSAEALLAKIQAERDVLKKSSKPKKKSTAKKTTRKKTDA